MPDQEEPKPVGTEPVGTEPIGTVVDDPIEEIVPEKPAADAAPSGPRFKLPAFLLRPLQLPRLPGIPQAAIGPAVTVFIVFIGLFLIYGHRWITGQSIFRGVVQEQYYLLGQYSFDRLIEQELHEGYFPLWNHQNALGTPLLGNMLSAACFPLKALIYLRDTDGVRDFTIVLRILLAALLAFALAREMKLPVGPAILAAVSFALTGYFKQFINENYLNADVLLPGMVLLALRLRRRGRRLDLALLALLTFCVLQNGHPESAFYCLLLPVVVIAATGHDGHAPAAARIGAAFTAGFVLSLPTLLPIIEYWARGLHFHAPYAGFFHYPASELPALVTPWFFPPPAAGAPFYSPPAFDWPAVASGLPHYATTIVPWLCPALGAVTFFFAAVAASAPKKLRRLETVLLAYAVFFLGVMYGLPGFQLLGFAPVFNFSGNFKHPEPAVALAVALLAGRGLALALDRRLRAARIFSVAVAIFIASLGLGVFQDRPGAVQFFLNRRSLAVMAAMLGAAGWTAVAALPPDRKKSAAPDWLRRPAASAVAVIAALFCLVLDGWHQPMRDIDYLGRIKPATLALLQEQAGIDRVYFSSDLFPPNLNILLGIPDLRVMDGVNDRRLVEVINRVNGHDRAEAGRYWYHDIGYLQPRPDRLDQPLLRLLNLRFTALTGPMPIDPRQRALADEADVLAPDARHVGRALLPLGTGEAPGLLLHPPARADLMPGESDEGYIDVRFHPVINRAAGRREPDGVWFNVVDTSAERLAYCRYLQPRVIPAETDPGPAEFDVRGGDSISFSTLPAASADFDQAGLADLRLGHKKDFDPQPWEEVTRAGNWLYRNPEALPRLFVAKAARTAGDERTLDALAKGEVDPRRIVVINDRGPVPGAKAEPGRRLAGEVRGFAYWSQRVDAKVEMWTPGWLVLSDLYFPGWRATVDGQPERIRRADYLLRALPLAAGTHRVVFTYEPAAFRLGLWAMLATLAFLTVLIWHGDRGRADEVTEHLAPAVEPEAANSAVMTAQTSNTGK